MNWDAAVANIKESPKSGQIGSMVELLCSKLLAQDQFKDLLGKHVATLLSIGDLPVPILENLQLLQQLVLSDLNGNKTYDTLLLSVEMGKKDVVLRVLFSDPSGHGAQMLKDIETANGHLQDQFERASQVENALQNLKDVKDAEDLCNMVARLAEMKLTDDDFKTGSVAAQASGIADLLCKWIVKIKGELPISSVLTCLDGSQPLQLDEAKVLFSSTSCKTVASLAAVINQEGITALLKRGSSDCAKFASSLVNTRRAVSCSFNGRELGLVWFKTFISS